MKKLEKLKLLKSSPLSNPQMKSITGGIARATCDVECERGLESYPCDGQCDDREDGVSVTCYEYGGDIVVHICPIYVY